ncbi:MAG: sensor histidine kinase [Thermoflavifilum sp.]|nr:sensor histidine kinase [Thermoflavifilum sp.]MCL6515245.1 sensor histidine kinase [Alicyclobacillus sp.]
MIEQIRQLAQKRTRLDEHDVEALMRVADQLQTIADLSGCDVFIDCLVHGRTDLAVVVAQAKPATARSLYSEYVVGQLILRDNEPGVFRSFMTGEYVTGTRAITNEVVTIQQKVLPIRRAGRVIGVLIMEQDISAQVEREREVALFQQTTEHLGETLWEVAVAETNLPSLIHEGVILVNSDFLFTYVNPTARACFEKLNLPSPEIGTPLWSFHAGLKHLMESARERGVVAQEFTFGENVVLIKAIVIRRADQVKGGLLLLSDITEQRRTEKQLMITSAVIKEIHHRVKNNLQTICSLLRLQMRRTRSDEIRRSFQDSINRIKAIALVHETLSQGSIEYVELNGMIERIVHMLLQTLAHPETRIQHQVTGASVVVPSAQATSVALIINELVQNCLNHAFEGRSTGSIEVEIQKEPDAVRIWVRDDGLGMNPARLPDDTLGLRIVRTLVHDDLNGHLAYERCGGTCVSFRFPYATTPEES